MSWLRRIAGKDDDFTSALDAQRHAQQIPGVSAALQINRVDNGYVVSYELPYDTRANQRRLYQTLVPDGQPLIDAIAAILVKAKFVDPA